MSRRNRSLVDQQLSLIDRLERNEEDPDRLDSLFRLDHLAARMRRNGANLLVLASAQSLRGEQRGPVPLSSAINAATSEVEDYRRVETSMVPDCTITGAASGDIVHLLAELIDNGLRYSPPASPVRVSASQRSDAAVLLEIVDVGLGMTDGDRRIANMRLRAGGEVTPDSARHMGLFVVGRLADRHGIRVRLRGSSIEQARSGTTAEVYLPSTVLAGADGGYAAPRQTAAARPAASAAGRPAGRCRGLRRLRRPCCAGRRDRAQRLPFDRISNHLAAAPQAGIQRHHRCPGRPAGSAVAARATAAPARRSSRADCGTPCGPTGFEHVVALRLTGAIHPAATSQSGAGRAGAGSCVRCAGDRRALARRSRRAVGAFAGDGSDLPADALGMAGRPARSGTQCRSRLEVGLGPRLVGGRRGRQRACAGPHRPRPAGA